MSKEEQRRNRGEIEDMMKVKTERESERERERERESRIESFAFVTYHSLMDFRAKGMVLPLGSHSVFSTFLTRSF